MKPLINTLTKQVDIEIVFLYLCFSLYILTSDGIGDYRKEIHNKQAEKA